MRKIFLSLALTCLVATGAFAATDLSTLKTSSANSGWLFCYQGSAEEITGTLQQAMSLTIEDGGTLTLNNADINSTGTLEGNFPALECLGDATIILKGANYLKGMANGYPAIYVKSGKTLTIKGDGSLSAEAGGNGKKVGAAGIGGVPYDEGVLGTESGNHFGAAGNIVIESGTIYAFGGAMGAAGIGAGFQGSCGNITIKGGYVEATGDGAAGIGSGVSADPKVKSTCGNISITGGYIKAEGLPGIGAGASNKLVDGSTETSCPNKCGNILIGTGSTYDKNITGTAISTVAGVPAIGKGSSDSQIGTVSIFATYNPAEANNQTYVFYGSTMHLEGVHADVTTNDGTIITGALEGRLQPVSISIADKATVVLNNASIKGLNYKNQWAGLTCLGDATIKLKGNNYVSGFLYSPAIFVPTNKTLTLKTGETYYGDGKLEALGQEGAPAIGASYEDDGGNVVFESGTYTLTGGQNAPAIGSGESTSINNVTIQHNVYYLKATAGIGAPYSVGAGAYGSFRGKILVDGEDTGSIEENPFIYETNTIATINNIRYRLYMISLTAKVLPAENGAYTQVSIDIPKTVSNEGQTYDVKAIADYAFAGCKNLATLTLPNGLETIGEYAASSCHNLKMIDLPGSVKTIGQQAYAYCDAVEDIYCWAEEVPETGSYAFHRCPNDARVHLWPAYVKTSLPKYLAHNEWKDFTHYEIPEDNMTNINYYLYYPAMEAVAYGIANNPTEISIGFEIRTTTAPYAGTYSVVGIEDYFAMDSKYLEKVTIPESIQKIGFEAFANCQYLKEINVNASNKYFKSDDGVLFNYAMDTLLCIPDGKEYDYTLPASVKYVGVCAIGANMDITLTVQAPEPIATDYYAIANNYSRLAVPAGSEQAYRDHDNWGRFWEIKAIKQAGESDTNQPKATPGARSVRVEWPKNDQADTYQVEIKEGSATIQEVSFNAGGDMVSGGAAPARDGVNYAPAAELTATGFAYTFGGLKPATQYTFIIKAIQSGAVLTSNSVNFTTDAATGMDEVQSTDGVQKFVRNGQLIIERDGKLYNASGAQMK